MGVLARGVEPQRALEGEHILWLVVTALAMVNVGCSTPRQYHPQVDGGDAAGVASADSRPADVGQAEVVLDSGNRCVAGDRCAPANSCHEGEAVCDSGGALSCRDTGRAQANGTVCGAGSVCRDGACVSCSADATCPVTGKPCRVGVVSCSTGVSVCIEVDNQPNGATCGPGMVCEDGECALCVAGDPCTPVNPCHGGALSCGGAMPQCLDSAANLPAGTSCGTDKVCSPAGACSACVAGSTCMVAGNPCRTGTTVCNTGAPLCIESGNVANGTSCGTGMVCNSSGTCTPCNQGGTCTPPTNPCHTGTFACGTGAPVCTDSGTSLPDGMNCGTNMVCRMGMCVACTAGGDCQPANPCKNGSFSCATGTQACVETTNKNAGTDCGVCAKCDGAGNCGTDLTQNGDCPSCQKCGARNMCVNENAEDVKLDCGQGSNQICAGGACVCNSNALRLCGGCLAWNFEGATSASPWLVDLAPNIEQVNGATNVQIAGSQVHGGSSSLAGTILIDLTTTFTAEVAVSPCLSGGTVNLGGDTVTAWVFLSGSPTIGNPLDFFFIDTWGPSGLGDNFPLAIGGGIKSGTWFQVSAMLQSGVPVNRIGFRLAPTTNWVGTMFIDDVVITGL